ncbi:MAG TPA: tRNA dihydrouridine synthase DusB [Methylomirabilota bacterium]|nr:tRNA dihydrouridine synthase DusB [Methylomirabilota bacterium]
MRIGDVDVRGLARLAPMAGATNAPFRLVARECGSGLTTTEEMDAMSLLLASPQAASASAYYPGDRPLAMQLLGKEPESLARAAARCEALGADIVDLNMGCPVQKITGKGKGAALMRDVPAAARILRAMRQAIRVPLTIKIRGGWDDTHLNAVEVAQMAEAEGVDAITVHPRTRAQQFTGKAPWTIIGEVVDAVRIPVTGNGDVRSMADARRMAAETGCRSVMIGRGALGRPWVFDEDYEALPQDARRAYRARIIARHVALIQEHCPAKYALTQLKKHLAWYTEGLGHARECRVTLFQTRSPEEAWETFQRYWAGAEREEAPELAAATETC